PMGGGYDYRNTFNPYYKNICRWMPDSCVKSIIKSGTYRVYPHDGATSLSRTLALKVGRDETYNYWIGIYGEPIPQTNYTNGVSVYAVSSYNKSDTHLLDLNDPGDEDRLNAPLLAGQTWYDSVADLTIKTVAVGGSSPNRYADVQITIGARNTGGYRPLVSGGVYRFKNRYNGKYLQIPGDSSSPGTSLEVGNATNDSSENWVVWRQSDGTYFINHQGTDMWIDCANNSGSDGADIIQYHANQSDAQRWHIVQNPDGYLYFTHKGTDGKAIDMDPNSNDVHQWQCYELSWQQWRAEMVGISPGVYRLLSKHAQGKCLDIDGGAVGNGAKAQLWDWSGGLNQQFGVSNLGGGRVRLTPWWDSSQALDVHNQSSADGTKIQQWTWNGNSAQRWSYSRIDGGWLRLTPDCATGSCLQVQGPSNNVANGSGITLWGFYNDPDQNWRFVDAN
ncbi:MAG: RICIN domain-containing protein, partial [Verrucomicrobiae bacterium]|nr:RICIN domain-containing protein [Verrucomicrobiae bacterium]